MARSSRNAPQPGLGMPIRALALLLATLLAPGCATEGGWLVGVWQIASWSVRVGDPGAPLLEETVADAGTLTFVGSGDWWESDLYYEGPDVLPDGAGGYRVIDQSAWTYWAVEDGEIWLAWGQDFSTPEVMIADSTGGDAFEAVSTYEIELLLSSLPVVTDWSLVREAP